MDCMVTHKGYAEQRRQRKNGRSWARYQHAAAGTFTGPHIDHDDLSESVHSYLQQLGGQCIVVAWYREELCEDELDTDPSKWYDQLKGLTSFSCAIMHGECTIGMRANTVHMVFTAQAKEQFTFHMYPH